MWRREEQESGMGYRSPRQVRRLLTHTVSWVVFLAVSLSFMVNSLSHMAAAGPSGVVHQFMPQALGGAVGITNSNPPDITAPAAYVFDADLGWTFYAKNADEKLQMASCTKVMTLLLAVEDGSLTQMVTIGADAAALVRSDSSFMGVSAGEKLMLKDLLYGLVLPSGNDAAVAIADAIGGNVPHFVQMMNDRARQLGMTHTHYVNPHGLGEPNHYTTARDLAILSGVAMHNPIIVQVTSAAHYNIPKTATHKAYSLETGNDLLAYARSPYPGAIGVKPGFTGDAGYCQAFAAIRHGHMIVGVVLDEPSWQVRIVDMRALLDWGFAQEGVAPAPPPVSWSAPPNV
jgi:serine-type D-Ala-D-Ala carboxypeptidase (penicillin-binding protein 5/6)